MATKKHAAQRHPAPGAVQISRAHKQCDTLVEKLRAVSAEHAAWSGAREQALELYRTRVIPLDLSIRHGMRELVFMLDGMHEDAGLDDGEREILSEILVDMASWLLSADENDEGEDEDEDEDGDDEDIDDEDDIGTDPELLAIYERHLGIDMDEEAELEQLFEEGHDIDLDDVFGAGNPEHDTIAQHQQLVRVAIQLEQYVAQQQVHVAHVREALDEVAGELKAALEGANGVTEADRLERLQRLDAAYGQGMLGEVIALAFELEQEGIIGHLTEKQVAGYKHVLKEALNFGEQGIVLGKGLILAQLELTVPPKQVTTLTPATLLNMIDTTVDELRKELADVEHDLVELRELPKLKAWLRAALD